MNVSLSDDLRRFVDEQVEDGGFSSTSEYVRDLIRRDRDRRQLRNALMAGASSQPGPTVDQSFLDGLRQRAASSH